MSRWQNGGTTGSMFPADPDTLRAAGPEFLTEAMHAFGALSTDNEVAAVTRFDEFRGGSTGRKAVLDVRYRRPDPTLPTALFVKFSRDFDDPRRDRGKSQMELEVAFGALSAATALPITVPRCLFADYHRESCTGILLTERISFDTGGIEPHYDKCLDYRMPDPVGHYRALLTSVAQLAGAHRAGRVPVTGQFRFDADTVTVGRRRVHTRGALLDRVQDLAEFGNRHPALLPAHLRTPEFTARMLDEVNRIAEHEDAVSAWLQETEDHVALCHWNANVDNAWFWRNEHGRLECGLMDWGCVSVMNVAMAVWGSLCSAETVLWDHHLDDLLTHFGAEYTAAGGPALHVPTLRDQLLLYAAVMGVAWLLDAPAFLATQDLAGVTERDDPRIADNEPVRAPLLMLTNFLNLWCTHDFGAAFDRLAAAAR